MPNKTTLRYLSAAQDDLFALLEWIAQDSPQRASSFVDKLDEHISRLELHPRLGRIPRHPKLKEYGYRVLKPRSPYINYLLRI